MPPPALPRRTLGGCVHVRHHLVGPRTYSVDVGGDGGAGGERPRHATILQCIMGADTTVESIRREGAQGCEKESYTVDADASQQDSGEININALCPEHKRP